MKKILPGNGLLMLSAVILFSVFLIGNYNFVYAGTFQEAEKLEKPEYRQASETEVSLIKKQELKYTSESLKDPFEPLIVEEKGDLVNKPGVGSQVTLPNLVVQGVIWGGNFPQAIINNKVVKIGDIVDGVRVVSINKEGVTVIFSERQFLLSSPALGGASGKNP